MSVYALGLYAEETQAVARLQGKEEQEVAQFKGGGLPS